MLIGNYEFDITCDACPEQYEVYDKDGNHVCYVRLRWGHLTAESPDVGGSLVYEAKIGLDGLSGCFESNEQRMIELKNIADRIDMFSRPVNCPYCGESHLLNVYHYDDLHRVGEVSMERYECGKYFKIEADKTETHENNRYVLWTERVDE